MNNLDYSKEYTYNKSVSIGSPASDDEADDDVYEDSSDPDVSC